MDERPFDGMALSTQDTHIFAACPCGAGMLIPIPTVIERGAIACKCSAEAKIDEPLIERLRAEEVIRHREEVRRFLDKHK